MAINSRKIGSIRVLTMSGNLLYSKPESLADLRTHVEKALEDEDLRLILDFTEVHYVDSAGIGETAACYKRIRERAGMMKVVVKPTGKPEELFTLTHMDRAFEMYPDIETALASFAE